MGQNNSGIDRELGSNRHAQVDCGKNLTSIGASMHNCEQ
jgi:hypothetical protein